MAKLNIAARKGLPAKDFAEPKKRAYPGPFSIPRSDRADDARQRANGVRSHAVSVAPGFGPSH
jgi:hypothetical protein